jgi:2-keto-4-pentenoate hydratase/2-oxohepta-3-ene-1,7-dioic acid hydratase in catechol pathway
VRFLTIEPLDPFGEDLPAWGVLVDSFIFPIAVAPWLRSEHESWRPAIAPGATALSLSEVRLLAPVTPAKIVCVGRNYAEHAAELGNEVPPEPLLFLKPSTSIIASGEAVVHPAISQRVDHEAELAVVIGSRCRFVSEAEALEYVFGYTVANDVTARDLQKSDGQWSRAKGFDTFCPVGPWLDTAFDPANRIVRCTVNGAPRQQASTSAMIFSVARIISHISQAMTLEPGDLILTGTPSGIGPVLPGDVMTVEIEGLGSIQNPVISEAEYRKRL